MPRSLFTRHEPSNPKDPENPQNILEPILELFQEALEGATKKLPAGKVAAKAPGCLH